MRIIRALPGIDALYWAATGNRFPGRRESANCLPRVDGVAKSDMRAPPNDCGGEPHRDKSKQACNTASDAKTSSSPEVWGGVWNRVKKIYDESPDIRGFFLKNRNNEQDTKKEGAENEEQGFLKRWLGWPWIDIEKTKKLFNRHQEVMIGLAVLSGIGIGLGGLNLVLQNQTLQVIKALADHACSEPKVEIKV